MSSSMFRKKSRSRVRHHRAQWKRKVTAPDLVVCSNAACGELKPQQVACPACGQYRGRQVVAPGR